MPPSAAPETKPATPITKQVSCVVNVLFAAAKARLTAPKEKPSSPTSRCNAVSKLRVPADNCPFLDTLTWEAKTFPGLENRMADGTRDVNYGRIYVARTFFGDFIRPSPDLRDKPAKWEYEQFFSLGAGGLGWTPDRVIFMPRGNRDD